MIRRLATVAATTAVTVAALVAPASADVSSVTNLVSTAGGNGAARLDATCHFGPVVPDNFEDQMYVTGVATAAGADSVTIRCSWETWGGGSAVFEQSSAGPVAVLSDHSNGWRSALRVCVSATADFGSTLGVVVTAPTVCS